MEKESAELCGKAQQRGKKHEDKIWIRHSGYDRHSMISNMDDIE
jgi:hypothetical protein